MKLITIKHGGLMDSFQLFKSNFRSDSDRLIKNEFIKMEDKLQLYETNANVRNLCFEWYDGSRALFNYAYLVSARLIQTEAINRMEITYTSNKVAINGYNLYHLFSLLIDYIPRIIPVMHPRYIVNPEQDQIFVTEISILKS